MHAPEPFQSVLVALDLADDAPALLQSAAKLPLSPGARLTLLHALPIDPLEQSQPSAREAQERTRHDLSQIAEASAPRLGRDITTQVNVTFGAAHTEIVRQTRTTAADLVVLGRSRRHRLDGSPETTILRRVLRHAGVPVLVTSIPEKPGAETEPGPETEPRSTPRRLLAAVDLNDGSRSVAELALRARGTGRDPITLLHVVHTPFHAWLGDVGSQLMRDAKERIDSFCASLPKGAFIPLIRQGDAHPQILAQARDADLVVVGTRGRTAIGNAIAGSLALELVEATAAELLTAPALRRSFGPA